MIFSENRFPLFGIMRYSLPSSTDWMLAMAASSRWAISRLVASDRAKAASSAVVGAFNSAAERLEGITKKLNASLGNGVGIG
jgi:hypothetical protein